MDKYDYSLVDYTDSKTKVKIICPKHGVFEQIPSGHLNGRGCSKCKESKGEKIIRAYLMGNNIKFISQKRFKDCRDKYPLPFDFYLPDYNTCIEFNGRQHYVPVELFGGQNQLNKQKKNDRIKMMYCDKNKIALIIIKHNENVGEKLINEILKIV